MHRQHCREPWASESSDHLQDARIIAGLADGAAQVLRVKLAV
jgi:hypothetical protein